MAGTDEELPNFNIMLVFGLPVSSEVPESNNENTESSSQEGSSINNKKIRFAEMETQQLDDIVNNSQAAKTKQATQLLRFGCNKRNNIWPKTKRTRHIFYS